jgi:hypothetical protein
MMVLTAVAVAENKNNGGTAVIVIFCQILDRFSPTFI